MNKKQVQDIISKYINFEISTPLYDSRRLNESEIEFVSEGLLMVKGKMNDPDVFIQTKDIKIIRGIGKNEY